MEHSISQESLLHAAADTGLILGGMTAANALIKISKQDTAIGNGAIAVGGLIGAAAIPNKDGKIPWYKALTMGVSAFGFLRLINIGVQEATAKETTKGLAGMIPESIKDKIREFVPNLSGDDVPALMGDEDEIVNGLSDINLNDSEMSGWDRNRTEDISYEEVPQSRVSGLGDVALLM